jgi:LCP family protein required for cell wall assembly
MSKFEFLKKIKFSGSLIGRIIFWGVTVALGITAFFYARDFTECWKMTQLPGVSPANCGASEAPAQFNPEGTPMPTAEAVVPAPPVTAPQVDLPPAWDGASRINILFIGLDYRDWQTNEGPPRSDTMILFTIDPVSKTAGMLSIPRDLWVNIPGFGYGRINMAYPSGAGSKLPGGGAGLAMKTVEQLLGVPVHYYVQIDFQTFVDLINMLGCITVTPEETLILDPVGDGPDHVKITAGGERELCGWKVLSYARTRKTQGGDTDRSRRQQQVIFALQEKIFDPENFPSLVSKAPDMYYQLENGIFTNMPFEDAVKLAMLGKDISRENIKTGIIDTSMATFDHTVLGGQDASVMKPMADKIRVLRDEIFTSTGPLSPVAFPIGSTDGNLLVQAMRDEQARVRIADGTFTPGLDQRAGQFFQSQGMNVTEVGAADNVYNSTVVVVYGPKVYTLKYLQLVFKLSNTQVRFNPDPSSTVDIEIRLGSDWAAAIP